MHLIPSFSVICVLLAGYLTEIRGQSTLPLLNTKVQDYACSLQSIVNCKENCDSRYKDVRRKTCPCYGKMFECLVLAGCDRTLRMAVLFECTRTGYCKDGYCIYRAGDVTPQRRENRGILRDFVTPVAERPCIGGCKDQPKASRTKQSLESKGYREDELSLPPRNGDPREGTNQHYDGMPYSIPVKDIKVYGAKA